jgi:hypothetical protein
LPPGIHRATWIEIEQRFGRGNKARVGAMAALKHVHTSAAGTGCLKSCYVFGSFVSRVAEPRDVDVW